MTVSEPDYHNNPWDHMPEKPMQAQIEAVKDTLRRLVILSGDSPWDWDDVARKVLTAAAEVQMDTISDNTSGMKPTQAQIEAAAKALCNTACNADCWHEQETQAEERDHWIGLATAALTAAAEVSVGCKCLHVSRHGHQDDCELTAAAEVGPYAGMQVNKDGLVLKYTDKDLQDTEDATIERCAQVAENWTDWHFGPDSCPDETIAAAIRALKTGA